MQKPIIVIPIMETKFITTQNFLAKNMLNCQNAYSIGGTDTVYSMEIRLQKSYDLILRSIWKYAYHDIEEYMEKPNQIK